MAVANQIMECVKAIWRAYYCTELNNASLTGGMDVRRSPNSAEGAGGKGCGHDQKGG